MVTPKVEPTKPAEPVQNKEITTDDVLEYTKKQSAYGIKSTKKTDDKKEDGIQSNILNIEHSGLEDVDSEPEQK